MSDWSSYCLLLNTHESVLNLLFDFIFSSNMTIIVLLLTFEISVSLVCAYIFMSFQVGAIQNSTEQRVGVLKNARVNEGSI